MRRIQASRQKRTARWGRRRRTETSRSEAAPSCARSQGRRCMPLSPEQEKAIRAAAESEGLDADELIAIAEEVSEDERKPRADDQGKSDAAKAEPPAEAKVKPNLYMYLLPFVTVNEV